jgi:hypothetical protein
MIRKNAQVLAKGRRRGFLWARRDSQEQKARQAQDNQGVGATKKKNLRDNSAP